MSVYRLPNEAHASVANAIVNFAITTPSEPKLNPYSDVAKKLVSEINLDLTDPSLAASQLYVALGEANLITWNKEYPDKQMDLAGVFNLTDYTHDEKSPIYVPTTEDGARYLIAVLPSIIVNSDDIILNNTNIKNACSQAENAFCETLLMSFDPEPEQKVTPSELSQLMASTHNGANQVYNLEGAFKSSIAGFRGYVSVANAHGDSAYNQTIYEDDQLMDLYVNLSRKKIKVPDSTIIHPSTFSGLKEQSDYNKDKYSIQSDIPKFTLQSAARLSKVFNEIAKNLGNRTIDEFQNHKNEPVSDYQVNPIKRAVESARESTNYNAIAEHVSNYSMNYTFKQNKEIHQQLINPTEKIYFSGKLTQLPLTPNQIDAEDAKKLSPVFSNENDAIVFHKNNGGCDVVEMLVSPKIKSLMQTNRSYFNSILDYELHKAYLDVCNEYDNVPYSAQVKLTLASLQKVFPSMSTAGKAREGLLEQMDGEFYNFENCFKRAYDTDELNASAYGKFDLIKPELQPQVDELKLEEKNKISTPNLKR
ncbi:MAG: hypothetical protein HAW67_02950 [Endozoicomonadaceae bacterium]|nr:hypothetical protein [Endozoicomonadaceae bacterium]